MSTPSAPLVGSPTDTSHLTTLIVALYIAAPCLVFLVAVPIFIVIIVRRSRRRKRERGKMEGMERKRRDLESVLGLGGRGMRV